MIKGFKDALIALRVLAVIIPLIRALMEAVEKEGSGADKKQAVLTALGTAIDGLPWTIGDGAKGIVLKIAGGLIDIIAGVLFVIHGNKEPKTV